MNRIWVISPYGKKSKTYGHGTYSHERSDKGFNEVWKYDLENETVAIGSSFAEDPSNKSRDEIRDKILESKRLSYRSAEGKANELWCFYNEIKEGDVILAKKGLRTILAFGETIKRDGNLAFYSKEKGLERTGNEYNPHPNFLNINWIEERMDFDENIFIIGRFKELHKMIINKKYDCYAPMIKEKIQELFGVSIR